VKHCPPILLNNPHITNFMGRNKNPITPELLKEGVDSLKTIEDFDKHGMSYLEISVRVLRALRRVGGAAPKGYLFNHCGALQRNVFNNTMTRLELGEIIVISGNGYTNIASETRKSKKQYALTDPIGKDLAQYVQEKTDSLFLPRNHPNF